jgi:hypothetical protein
MLMQKPMTKKDRVIQNIMSRGRVRTSEVIRFGSQIFHNRALRDAQQACQDGIIYRMREDLKRGIYGETREDVFTADRMDS